MPGRPPTWSVPVSPGATGSPPGPTMRTSHPSVGAPIAAGREPTGGLESTAGTVSVIP